MPNPAAQLKLRVPRELRIEIAAVANRNGRSMNEEMVMRLRRSFFEDRLGAMDARLARIERILTTDADA